MSWNDGYERKKFERKQVGQAKRFKDLGMTDEQIQEIYALDLREYRDNRIFQFIPNLLIHWKMMKAETAYIRSL